MERKIVAGLNPIAATFLFRDTSYLRLEIAIMIMPSIATAMAGATTPPDAPAANIHIDNPIQSIPTINLSFLTYISLS